MRLRRALSVAVIVVTVGAAVAARGAEAARQPFLWGAATSSYQVEGGITNNDYDFFNRSPIVQDTVRTNSRAVGPSVELSPAGERFARGSLATTGVTSTTPACSASTAFASASNGRGWSRRTTAGTKEPSPRTGGCSTRCAHVACGRS